MKLKYYLRGLGMGILFATIIMTISSAIHKNDISDEEIIKRAQKLGMVMTEDTQKDNSLWGSTENTETSAIPVDTEAQDTEKTSSAETETSKDTQMQSEVVSEKETEKTTKDTKKEFIQITIRDSDAARQVSETLYYNGLVKDAEDFRQYLAKKGYATRIRSGTFEIPVGASYQEICDIIVNK